MLEQHLLPPVADGAPTSADLATIHAWITDWKTVRHGVERLLDDAVGSSTGHDVGPFLTLLDEIDSSIRLLNHRVSWLTNQLSHRSDL
jgi:hypothetical protein